MIDALRVANVVLSLLVAAVGTPQWSRWWRTYPPEVLQGRLALAALVLAIGYGSAEALYLHAPGGPRTVVTTVGLLWAFYTVAWLPAARITERISTCRRSTGSPTTPRPRTPPTERIPLPVPVPRAPSNRR
jgi:hypothetical protein